MRAVTGRDAVLIGSRLGESYRGPKLEAFRADEQLSPMGLAGFWRFTCERFFVLEEHMRATGLTTCLHIESDTLLYVDPSRYGGWLRETYGDGLATCPMTATEDTASVFYVGSLGALERFNDALLELVRMEPAALLETYGGGMANEMRMLHVLRSELGLSQGLPVSPEQALAAGSEHVFDPGSYGQFVDGGYWQPGVSGTSASHLLAGDLETGRFRVLWDRTRDHPLVFASGSDPQPMANLHIHSKRLADWTSRLLEPDARPAGFPSEATARARLQRAANASLAAASRIRRGNWRRSA